jgi:hypothetical protein
VPEGGQITLQSPGTYGHAGSRVALVVDATFEPGPVLSAIESRTVPGRLSVRFQDKLTLSDLYEAFLALIETALSVVAPAVFPAILGVSAWERIGPTGYIQTFRPPESTDELTGIGRYVDLEGYVNDRVDPNLDMQAANPFHVPRTAGFETKEERADVVRGWLTGLLLDMGLEGFEEDLAAMSPVEPSTRPT